MLHLLVPLADKMTDSTLIQCLYSHPVAFRFWASSSLDNVNINPAKKEILRLPFNSC